MDLINVRSCCRLNFWKNRVDRQNLGVMHFQPWPQLRNSAGSSEAGKAFRDVAARGLCLHTPASTSQSQAALGRGHVLGLGNSFLPRMECCRVAAPQNSQGLDKNQSFSPEEVSGWVPVVYHKAFTSPPIVIVVAV